MPHYLIVLSGRSGCGKSSVANEMAAQLRRRGIPHANVDGDNLDAMYPEPTDDGVMLANLEGMWRTYSGIAGDDGVSGGGGSSGEAAQVDRLIVSGTAIVLSFERIVAMMERVAGSGSASATSTTSSSSPSMATATPTEEEEATGDGQHHPRHKVSATAIILTASDDTAAQRLRGREVGSELEACLASSGRMGRVLEEEVGDWAERVATDGVGVRDTAMRVLRVAGWV